jgi:hypothetical protein
MQASGFTIDDQNFLSSFVAQRLLESLAPRGR